MRHDPDSSNRRWRALPIIAIAVVAAAAGFWMRNRPIRYGVVNAAATLRFRPSEARLSSEVAYHPAAPRYRGSHAAEASKSLQFLAAAGELDDQPADANTIDHLHQTAAARIYLGELHPAVTAIQQALQRADAEKLDARKRARLWNDLAVAQLGLVENGEERRYLVDALDAAETAWAADPTSVSTAWTRALLLEKLSNRRSALLAWQAYLRLDAVSPWATEARKHVAALHDRPSAETSFTDAEKARLRKALFNGDHGRVQEIVSAFPTDARIYCEKELLPEWAGMQLRKLQAEPTLGAVSELANTIRSRSGESLLLDAVAQIRASDPATRDRLGAAIAEYRSALEAYRAKQVRVLQRLEVAEEALRAVGSPMAIWANLYRTAATYSENDFGKALAVLNPKLDPCNGGRRYYAACGLKNWLQGLILVQSGHPAESLDSYEHGLAAFRAADEPDNVAIVLSLRAETLDFMSAADEAWADRMTGLKMFENRPMGARPLVWMIVAQAALREHRDRAAAVMLDEIAADARERGDAMWYAEALVWRLIATNRLDGKVQEADINAARAAIAQIPRLPIRTRSQANLGLVLAEVRGSEPAARGDLDQALEFYSASEDRFNGTAALMQRAKVRATTADFEGAGADVVAALDEFQRQSEEMDDPLARTVFSERSRELFLTASRLQAEHDKPLAALWFSDRARESAVRQFQGEKGSASSSSGNAEDRARALVRRIPPNVTVVHQDLDGDVLRTWAVRNGQVGFTSRTVNGALLRADVADLRGLLKDGSEDDFVPRARQLYDILLRPERESFAGNGLLVYSPSPELRGLPVDVLHDGEHFLIEQRPIAIARSLGSLGSAKLRSAGEAASVLVVNGAPTAGAPLLEAVERESAALARWYGARGSVLSGEDATPRAFLDAAPRYDIIHVGAHARTDRRPLQNAIELDSGRRLRAFDVMHLTLPKAPIVVLGGCSTDDETTGRATLSLANAFAYAGASAVVGSLWDVEDTGAMHLLVQFHKELGSNVYAAEALRRAQLTAIRNHDPVTVWAAFQLHL